MSAGSSPVLGLECKMYAGPEGLSIASLVIPENEMKLVRTVNFNLTQATADVTTRGSGWRLQKGTLKEGAADGEMMYVPGSRETDMFMNAWLNGNPLSMFISDGFGYGLFADFAVLEMGQSQPLEDVVIINYSVAPTLSKRFPKMETVATAMGPIINSSPDITGTAGSALTFQFTSTPAATSWSAEGLPTGLSLSGTTGELTGTVDDPGVFWPYITATNAAGSSTKMVQILIE